MRALAPISRHRPAQQGQMVVIFALALTAMLATAGLLLDGGMAFAYRRQAQAAADTAALAAAQAAAQGFTGLAAKAQDIATANGFPAAYTDCSGHARTDGLVVTGPYTGVPPDTNKYVQAVVKRSMRTTFSAVVGQNCWMVGAHAVARVGSLGTFLTKLQDLHLRPSYYNMDDYNTRYEYYADFSVKRGASTILTVSASNLCYPYFLTNQGALPMADVVVTFPSFAPLQLQTGDVLQLKLSTRTINTVQCGLGSHAAGSLMIWYDSTNASYQSKFGVTIGGATATQYLHSNGTYCTGVSSLSFSPTAPTTANPRCTVTYATQNYYPPVVISGSAGTPHPTLWTQTVGPTPPIIPSVLVE